MKPEQRFWRNRVRPALIAIPGLEYERVELRTGKSGIPDVYVSHRGTSAWLELKWASVKEEATGTVSEIDLSGWAPEQRGWAKRHGRQGAKVFLLVGTSIGHFIINAFPVTAKDSVKILDPAVLWYWAPHRIDPAELSEVIRRTVVL